MRIFLVFLIFLSGCVTDPAVIAARQQRLAEQQEAEKQAYLENLASQCEALGYSQSQPDFRQCMLQMHQAQQNEQQARRAAALGYLLQQQPRPATTTNCQRTFSGVQCSTR